MRIIFCTSVINDNYDRSSDKSGICYVETSNLDGESNLKQRQVYIDEEIYMKSEYIEGGSSNGEISFSYM